MKCRAAESRAVRHRGQPWLTPARRQPLLVGVTYILCVLFQACWFSSRPAPRTGPLAPLADSLVMRVSELTCRGPFECYGPLDDTVFFYLSSDDGQVEVIGRHWQVPIEKAQQTVDSLTATLTARYGEEAPCRPRGVGYGEKMWVWTLPTQRLRLSWTPPALNDTPTHAELRFDTMLTSLRCDRPASVPRFM